MAILRSESGSVVLYHDHSSILKIGSPVYTLKLSHEHKVRGHTFDKESQKLNRGLITCSQTQTHLFVFVFCSPVPLHLGTNHFLQHYAATSLTSTTASTQTTHKVTSLWHLLPWGEKFMIPCFLWSSESQSTQKHKKCQTFLILFWKAGICGKRMEKKGVGGVGGGWRRERDCFSLWCCCSGMPPGTESKPASPESLSPRAAGDRLPPKSSRMRARTRSDGRDGDRASTLMARVMISFIHTDTNAPTHPHTSSPSPRGSGPAGNTHTHTFYLTHTHTSWLGLQLNQKWFVFIGLLRWQVGYHSDGSTCQWAAENPQLTMPNASN